MRASFRRTMMRPLLCAAVCAWAAGALAAELVTVRTIDAQTRKPIAGAVIVVDRAEWKTDARGEAAIEADARTAIHARACGYQRTTRAAGPLTRGAIEIPLTRFTPKAVYLSMFGAGDRRLRTAALDLIEATELNAIVIDVKGDRGYVAYRSEIPLAAEAGAQQTITLKDLPGLLASLRERGVYTIARIVVFKDDKLASARPDLAVRTQGGAVFHDRERLAWTNPFSREVWVYNIGIAVEAARAGFDEIQFDYVRLPDSPAIALDGLRSEATRTAAIDGFLTDARRALVPWNVFLAADVFGYVCWNENDTRIGQRLEHVVDIVDYVSPMLYPSSFQFGIPGHRNPVQQPYDIVHHSIARALERTSIAPVRVRPWIQAFRDYAFGGVPFTGTAIRAQITAAETLGTDGWMLWNPQNRYTADGLAR